MSKVTVQVLLADEPIVTVPPTSVALEDMLGLVPHEDNAGAVPAEMI